MSKPSSLVRDSIRNILIVFLCFAGPFLYAGYRLISEVNRQQAVRALDERAALVLQLLENDLQNKIQSLEHATGILKAKDFAQTKREDVESISKQFTGVVWSGLAGLDGKVLYSTQGILEGVDVNARPWFKAGLKKPSIMDRHDALLLASKLPPRSDPYKFIDMAVPVYSRDNSLEGVLAIHMDWTWYQNQFTELLGVQLASSIISTVITGKDGELRVAKLGVGQTPANFKEMLLEIKAHSEAESASPSAQNGQYLITSLAPPEKSKLASLGLTVHLLQPAHVVTNQSISAITLAMLALLVGMLSISLLMVYSARRLSRRIANHLDVIEHRSIEEMEKSEATLPREAAPLMQRTRELFTRARTKAQLLKQQLAIAESSFTEINSLIQQAPVAIAMFDRDMNYLACSELWKRIYLHSGGNPIGKSHYELVPNIPEEWKVFHQRGLAGEALQKSNDSWTDASGEQFWLHWSIEPWKDKSGAVGGLIIATADVTQSHKAQVALAASEERFQLAMEGSSDGLYDWDVASGEVYLSPGWKKMVGYQPDELPDEFDVWKRLLHPDDRLASEAYLNKVIADPEALSLGFSFRLAHKSGAWVKVLSRGKILRDQQGNAIRVVGTHFDRTEIENLQSELQEAWVHAQAEAKSNETKSRFLATVSHEIRNPLNAVTGFARLIADESTEPHVSRFAQMLNQTTDSLRLILNDILDFAKIDAGKLEIIEADFNLSELMDTLGESARLQCVEKSISFELTKQWCSGYYFRADAGRIRQIAQNLLSNAVKFTAEGAVRFKVSMHKLDASHEQMVMEVTDSGRGIPAEKLDLLFKPFSQIHNDSFNKIGGTGLGLTIVKSLAEAMGGTVSCESKEGVGSTFTVKLPLRKGLESPIKPVLKDTAKSSKRILIADDMPSNLHILNAFLSRRGHQVSTAENGRVALEKLQTENFDFVLLDLDMPELSGLEVVSAIRAGEGLNQNAVFACVTGHAMQETMQATLGAGFDVFIPKPVDFDQLLFELNR